MEILLSELKLFTTPLSDLQYKKIFQLIGYCITPIINTIVALLLLMLISVELLSEKLRGDKNAN